MTPHKLTLVFSGDLGVMHRPLLRDPTIIKKADYVIMESTYGNRVHPNNSMDVEKLMEIIVKTTRRGGTVVIPSFAVGRTQELIYELNKYYENRHSRYKKDLDKLNVYIDSPMATAAIEVFRNNAQVFDQETREYILKGDDPLDFVNLKFTRSTENSQQLNMNRSPKIIISASGMCEAGRIRHHLKHNLWDKKSSIVFVGYQAEGTLGRALLGGAKEVTLFGEPVQVNAEIYNLEGFSGHADRNGLMEWISGFQQQPKQVFLVHGEEQSKKDLAKSIEKELGYEPVVITNVSEFSLENAGDVTLEDVIEETVNQEMLEDIKEKLAEVHGQIENVLYNSSLRIGEELSADQIIAINNLVQQLDKNTVDLGAALAEPADV